MKTIFKLKNFLFILFISAFYTYYSHATTDGTENIKELLTNITDNILSTAGTVLMTAAFITFFYGVVVFLIGRVSGSGDLKDIEKGKEFMLWGLIALFLMVSVWGIIRFAQDILGVSGSNINIQPVSFKYNDVVTDSSNDRSGLLGDNNGGVGDTVGDNPEDISSYPTIKAPSQDEKIKTLFTYLKDKNCTGTMNTFGTTYDDTDATLVKAFQKANNLTDDGIVGQNTWKALASTASKPCK